MFSSYGSVRRSKKKKALKREKLLNKCLDVFNLNYLVVIDKNTGLNVYEEYYAEKIVDASLISGFLEAIRTFGIELTGSQEQSQMIKLEYKNSKVLMSEFHNFRLILVLKDMPSEDFIEAIPQLSKDINNHYGKDFENFKGSIDKFKGIKKLIEKNLNTTFLAPLKIDLNEKIELTPAEKALKKRISTFMAENSMKIFYTLYLMSMESFNLKMIGLTFNLIEKGVLKPYREEELISEDKAAAEYTVKLSSEDDRPPINDEEFKSRK